MRRRAGWILLVIVVMDMLLDNLLPFQTYADVMSPGVPNPVPLAHSDYLPFTLVNGAAAYEVNVLGYRSIYPLAVAKGNKPRVLLLGDSFTYGYRLSYADSYAGQLQQMMPDSEVINAGFHDAFSPDAYYAYVMREGLVLSPDVVILNLYSGNDLTDLESTNWIMRNARGAPLAVTTMRHYPDAGGRMINPDTLSWYYAIPFIRDRRLTVGLMEFAARLTGTLPGAVSHEEAQTRFTVVMQAFARLDVPVYVYLFDSPVPGHPSDAADNAFMRDVLVDTFPPGRVIDDIGAYSTGDIIPGDAHFNEPGRNIRRRGYIS